MMSIAQQAVDPELLCGLAQLLEYPGQHSPALVASVQQAVTNRCPAAFDHFERFSREFLALSEESREELATATFEITPMVVPYVSIHLFGEENFKRGEFMAALSAQYAQRGFNPRGELPDHIAALLRFVAKLPSNEQRDLLQFCILGPVTKMIGSLDQSNPFQALLKAVRQVLRSAYPDLEAARSPLEQMRKHDAGCASIGAACHCGPATKSPASIL